MQACHLAFARGIDLPFMTTNLLVLNGGSDFRRAYAEQQIDASVVVWLGNDGYTVTEPICLLVGLSR